MIAIVSYQATWEAEFMRLGRHLRQNLGDLALRIDHIGSTTIPGLAAKDIIDIQITARALTPTLESALNLAGYHRVSHITQDHLPPGKNEQAQEWLKWFFTPSSAQRPVNVHIRMPGRANQRYALLFRDYVGNRKNGRAQWDYVTGLKPDIVLLQECRPPSHYLDQAQLHQRAPYFLWESIDGVSRPKGVCVYTNGLPIQQLSLNKFCGRPLATTVTPRSEMQVVVISIHVDTTGKVFKTAKEAARQLFDELSSLLQCSPYVILAGDLNLTVHWSEADVPVRDRLVTEFGLVNCTNFLQDKTRLLRNEVSTLRGYPHQDDYIFVSSTFEVNYFDVLQDTELSDHCPVVADLSARLTG